MNAKEKLRHLSSVFTKNWDAARAAICKAAREVDGVVLTETFEEATHLQRKYDVTARCVDINLEGFNGPFFLDPMASNYVLKKAAEKIESLEIDAEFLKLKIERLAKP